MSEPTKRCECPTPIPELTPIKCCLCGLVCMNTDGLIHETELRVMRKVVDQINAWRALRGDKDAK